MRERGSFTGERSWDQHLCQGRKQVWREKLRRNEPWWRSVTGLRFSHSPLHSQQGKLWSRRKLLYLGWTDKFRDQSWRFCSAMIIFKGKKEKWSQLITKCISLCAKSVQWCPTLCGPMDWSPPGSSVHGILQARILEGFAMPSSRGSSWPRDQTWVFHIAGRFFTLWATKVPSTYGLEGHKCSGHGKMVQYFKCT